MALPEKLEKGLPVWSRLYDLESYQSRLYGLKGDIFKLLNEVQSEEELEPLMEMQDYLDAALERCKWVTSAVRRYAEAEGITSIPPQSDSSLSEATGSRKSQK
jgi:hypothetical protein